MLGVSVSLFHMRPDDFYGLTFKEYWAIHKVWAKANGVQEKESADDIREFLHNHIATKGIRS